MDKLPIQWESEMQKKNTLGKFLCSEQETTEHSRVQPIIKMKGKFPSNLPSRGMVNIPSWLPWPDSSNTTHFFEGRKRGWGVKYTFYSRKCFIGWAISVSTIFNSVKRKYFWIAHFLQELKHKAVCLQSPACSRCSLVLLLPMPVTGQPQEGWKVRYVARGHLFSSPACDMKTRPMILWEDHKDSDSPEVHVEWHEGCPF